jgi:hypothetical protein
MDSVIVLVLLGVIWAAVLIPPWLHGRREAQPAASIRVFRRQLWSLGQGPVAGARRERYGAVRFVSDDGAVAYGPGGTLDRLEALRDLAPVGPMADEAVVLDGAEFGDDTYLDEPDGDVDVEVGAYADAAEEGLGYGARRAGVPAVASYPEPLSSGAAAVAIALEPDWSSAGPREPAGSAARRWAERAPQQPVASGRSPAAARSRARAYRRRRQVMVVLLVAVAVTLGWALVLQLSALWVAHAVADVLLVAYVTLLVRLRRRSVERADKVHYLAPIEAPRPAVVVLHG